MTIYDFLRKLTLAASRSGMLSPTDTRAAIDLIDQLRNISAFGTAAGQLKGIDDHRIIERRERNIQQ